MSDSLKQDLIKSIGIDNYIRGCKQIDQMYDDIDNGIFSNIEKVLEEDFNNMCKDRLQLFNIQYELINKDGSRHENKFVFAYDEADAKKLVFKQYQNFKLDIIHIFCQKVDIKRGMMFNV